MTWDGQGLPPAARARIERARTDRIATSLLSPGGQAAVQSVGLDPVGEVMGCIVEQIGWSGWGGCGVMGFGGRGYLAASAPTVTSSRGGYGGYRPYVDALYRGYDTALSRMLTEAQALGADGVVGVRWTQERLGEGGAHEFVARGTAVRARSSIRPAYLFSTDLSGTEVTRLIHAGWVPAGLELGISVSIRHDDYATRMAARSWSGQNVEVPGYTELVTYARADARDRFEQRAARHGADAATVSDMSLEVYSIEPSDGHVDHVAHATVLGNAVLRFHAGRAAPTRSLSVLPLTR
ncbi:MAG TPA: heavy metal-binding domain-containing protein [Mycobacteriales bacterium]|nr:heavy metal-binding domain-containing protein [Mycobacteriales bacterium]